MPLRQLYYTSCEAGVTGHSGFQFCAMTPGVPKEVMREVERLTFYELPRNTADAYDAETVDPTKLVYAYAENRNMAIIAQVKSAGIDFSGRPGNYFAHSLVTDRPRSDLSSGLPIEFWKAPFWISQTNHGTDLPELRAPLEPGHITRDLISSFLLDQPESQESLAILLSAVERAMHDGLQVRIMAPSAEIVCFWIAAASYLLGNDIARNLTFCTYTHDPYRSLLHIVGGISRSRSQIADTFSIGASTFELFDAVSHQAQNRPPIPVARLLSRIGVAGSAELWDLATALGTPVEASLAGWYPILANAAILMRRQLTPAELAEATGWLTANADVTERGRITAVIECSLEQPVERLPARSQTELIDLAFRVAAGQLASKIECAVVSDIVRQFAAGTPVAHSIVLRTEQARALASDGCSRLLPIARAGLAIELLAWATTAEVTLPDDVVAVVGMTAIGALAHHDRVLGIDKAACDWPALRTGMVRALAALPAASRQLVLESSAVQVLGPDDFLGEPGLGEEWFLTGARLGQIARMAALDEIARLRRSVGRLPSVDADLVACLWNGAAWTLSEGRDAIARLQPPDLGSEPVCCELTGIMRNTRTHLHAEEWMIFVTVLADVPPGVFPPALAFEASMWNRLIGPIREATENDALVESAVQELIAAYSSSEPGMQRFLDAQLPHLLLRHPRAGRVLSKCPQPIFNAFCRQAATWMSVQKRDVPLAATLFLIFKQLEKTKELNRAKQMNQLVLAPVLPKWNRRQIRSLRRQAEALMYHGSFYVGDWYSEERRRRTRRLIRRIRRFGRP